MSESNKSSKASASCPPSKLAKFRAWFIEFDARAWDRQIEADQRAGKFDQLVAEANVEYKAGKAREL